MKTIFKQINIEESKLIRGGIAIYTPVTKIYKQAYPSPSEETLQVSDQFTVTITDTADFSKDMMDTNPLYVQDASAADSPLYDK